MEPSDLASLLKLDLNSLFPEPAPPESPILPEPEDQIDQTKLRKIVSYLDLYYHYNEGSYPPLSAVSSETGLPSEEILSILEEDGNSILRARGLPEFNCAISSGELDPEFIMACNFMADAGDKRSNAAKLKEIGKTPAWWTASLKKRKHAEYFRMRVEQVWDNELKDKAKIAVGRLIDRDDLNAVKYYHEFTGEFTPSQATVLNLQFIIQILMEILARHLPPATLATVADELEKSGVLEIGPGKN